MYSRFGGNFETGQKPSEHQFQAQCVNFLPAARFIAPFLGGFHATILK
jgi:hypothetical protein